MWDTIGLALNALGAALVLIPDIPAVRNWLVNIPPFSRIEEGKKQLYMEGELEPSDPAFTHISEAVIEGTRVFPTVERMDEIEGPEAAFSVGEESVKFDKPGYEITRIEKIDDAPLAQAVFSVTYTPKAGLAMEEFLSNQGMESPSITSIVGETPPGRLPQMIENYEMRILSRSGMTLLLTGFIFQATAQMGLLT